MFVHPLISLVVSQLLSSYLKVKIKVAFFFIESDRWANTSPTSVLWIQWHKDNLSQDVGRMGLFCTLSVDVDGWMRDRRRSKDKMTSVLGRLRV